MFGTKYRYNPKSCSYERIKLTKSSLSFYFLRHLCFVVVCSAAMFYLRDRYFFSPKERLLTIENNGLKTQYSLILKDINNIEERLSELQNKDDDIYRTILGTEPLAKEVRECGTGGVDKYSELSNLDKEKLIFHTVQKADKLLHRINVQMQSFNQVLTLAKKRENDLKYYPSIQPVDNKDLKRLSGSFGMRLHPTLGVRKMHSGQDFAVPCGRPVYATANGIVKRASFSRTGGNLIIVKHGKMFCTKYMHLKAMFVKAGQMVLRGQKIGLVGKTGTHCLGAHLHYEILKKGKHTDPTGYFFGELSAEQYAEVKMLSQRGIAPMD